MELSNYQEKKMKKHTVTISNNFVRNVKRMWDSPFAAYKEIIQNALRAGAKTIRVSYDDGQTLVVEDDGQGFDDIRSLLTIGDSGWGDDVVEPAGVGIFAAPAFAEEVTIQSGKRKLILTGSLFEDGKVEERETKTAISGTRVVVKGIKLDKNQVDILRGYIEADFYFNGELIPNPLENEDYLTTPYGRLYLRHHKEYSIWQYNPNARIVWEGYPLDARFISLPGIWVVDTRAVPGELRPQLPHRDRLIQNAVYHKTIKEINDFFDNWATEILSKVDIKKMPGLGKYEKIAAQLEKEVDRDQIPGALVHKGRDYFYTRLSIPILEEPTIDWEGAFGYVDDFENETIYTRNDLVLEVSLPCQDYDGFPEMLINAQTEQPMLVKFVEKKKHSNLAPINLYKQEGGWYCVGWELDGGYIRGIDVMVWPTKDGDRIVFAGKPAHLAQHTLNNAELWSIALTCLNNDTLSMYWSENGDGFGVLPGEVLVDVYRAMGQEENDARIYVKLQQVKNILTEYGLPEAYRKIAMDNLRDLEKTFCTAGYIPPENAGPIFSF
jgi:hypothetical protein